eukprot:gnl/TRDRNA2_/TRDRNA2_79706_c0_seq1.p1 gnl/TRDRNA2_/TRDRNA2_79706_c0~~gnl/TRDRNA2_/TRDRNA2_79706_c0_seq1.p1  ORF type:complete len:164 (+),score=19.48 gnl/TRDRNA2_/TRDRNA2_79706_c0_seq1:129-620(+)
MSPHTARSRTKKKKCATASWEICLAMEQVAPISEMHLEFADLRYQHCESPAARREALHYLFIVWLLRCGSAEGHRAATYSGPLRQTPPAERRRLVQCFSSKMQLCKTGGQELLEDVCSRGFGDLLDASGLLLRIGSAVRNHRAKVSALHGSPPTVAGGLDEMD